MRALCVDGTCAPVMRLLFHCSKALLSGSEVKDTPCPNGCTEGKCGKDCPEGCCKPCGNKNCGCHKKRQACGEPKPKCHHCHESGCSPCSHKPSKPACSTNTEESGTSCPRQKAGPCGNSCPINNCPSPCAPCVPAQKDPEEEPEARARPSLQPGLPALDAGLVRYLERLEDDSTEQEFRDLEVVTEDQPASNPVDVKFGLDLSPAALFVFNTTCADVQVAPGEVKLSWQVKLGPCVWQVRYSKAGCCFDYE